MNRQRLVLLLEDLIYIYDVANMKSALVWLRHSRIA